MLSAGVVDDSLIDKAELESRLQRLRMKMSEHEYHFILVYGEEKHYENVKYLTGFDPRFESALVVVSPDEEPVVLTGVESARIFDMTGRLGRVAPFLPFSIQGVTGEDPSDLRPVLADLGIKRGHRVGLVGERYFTRDHYENPAAYHFFPQFVWHAVCQLTGTSDLVRNSTDLLTDKVYGLRARKSAREIVMMEAASVIAARAIARMMDVVRPGMTELELMAEGLYAGKAATFAFHPTVVSGERCFSSLLSPSQKRLKLGEPISLHYGPTVYGYCGNIDRLGLLATGPRELPSEMRDIVELLYQPMFDAYVAMLRNARIGLTGAQLFHAVMEPLHSVGLQAGLNAGHLIGLAEWEGAYTTKDSFVTIESGHVMQADFNVLTLRKTLGPARIQEGLAYADQALRKEIRRIAPETWDRIERRRVRLADSGIRTDESVLPLSDLAPTLRPYLLNPDYVLEPRAQRHFPLKTPLVKVKHPFVWNVGPFLGLWSGRKNVLRSPHPRSRCASLTDNTWGGELCDDVGSDVLRPEFDALSLGRNEDFVGRRLVAGDQLERPLGLEIESPLKPQEQGNDRVAQSGDGSGLIGTRSRR